MLAVSTLPRHGGNLAAAEARWGRPQAGWLDLSTGINPWPYPLPALPAECWSRLPGTDADLSVREAAAAAYGAAGPDWVLPAPGTGALIQWLPRIVPRGRVAVIGPTYGEHEAAWRLAGHEVSEVSCPDAARGADVVVVVRPNNPDGRMADPAVLKGLASLVVVDEAFADTMPECSVIPSLDPAIVVLRSFGKFYGLAGLRLGFALGHPSLLARLAGSMGPWSVSGPALAIGALALRDAQWAAGMRARLAGMADRLDRVLVGAGMDVAGGTSLFRFARHADAGAIYDRLGRAGILVRAFDHTPDALRFGLPDGEAALERLSTALARD